MVHDLTKAKAIGIQFHVFISLLGAYQQNCLNTLSGGSQRPAVAYGGLFLAAQDENRRWARKVQPCANYTLRSEDHLSHQDHLSHSD